MTTLTVLVCVVFGLTVLIVQLLLTTDFSLAQKLGQQKKLTV